MKLLALLLVCAISLHAQMQIPAGTRSALEVDQQQRDVQAAEEALQKSDAARAKSLLSAVLQIDRKDARAGYDLGLAYELLNDSANAEKTYRSVIAVDNKQFESRLALGLLLARAGKNLEAREQLIAATERTPVGGDLSARATAFRALAAIDASSNPPAATEELLQALKLSPETPDDRALAAQIASSSGEKNDAETAYRRVLQTSPGDLEASIGLARLLTAAKNYPDAEGVLTDALKAHPGDLALSALLADLYGAEDKPEAAIPLLEAAHAAHPDEAAVSRMLARIYVRSGAPEKSDPLYLDLLKKTPNDVELLDDYGDALIRQKRSAEAEEVLKRAISKPEGFSSKLSLAGAAAHLAFASSSNHDPLITLQALELRNSIVAPSASSLFLAAIAHDRLHHMKVAVDLYRQFLSAADGRYPNEEWEAKHRIPALLNAK